MPRPRPFAQVDVFGSTPLRGNPVAVVLDADGLDETTMAAFAAWTNLSETTFVGPPTDPGADYAVRIFTPSAELPFAGHPTLGTAHAWLAAGGRPAANDRVVQQCPAGLVPIRMHADGVDAGGRLAFAAPPLRRTGPLEPDVLATATAALGLTDTDVVDHQWVDNGPGWAALRLADADRVLAVSPDPVRLGGLALGVVGTHPPGGRHAVEVRAFVGGLGVDEDPVTGSLNAGLAQWLVGAGVLPPRYTATQGTRVGRAGIVEVVVDDAGTWIGGACRTLIEGAVTL